MLAVLAVASSYLQAFVLVEVKGALQLSGSLPAAEQCMEAVQKLFSPFELSGDVRIYSTEERRLHTTCLETAKKAMENFGLFE